jgi:hypothetical protein
MVFFRIILILLSLCLIACDPNTHVNIPKIVPHCLEQQSQCVINTKYGDVSVLFDVEKVLTEHAFSIRLEGDFLSEEFIVESYLEGKDMFMGKIPLFFELDAKNTFISEALLGSCSEKKMTWRLWLTIKKNNKGANQENTMINSATFYIDFPSNRV